MANDRIIETVQGVVASVSPKGTGFRLDGAESWINLSKYAPGLACPPRGAAIVAGLDKAGFCRELEIVTAEKAAQEERNIGPHGPMSQEPNTPTTCPPDREQRITRSASINSAIAALQTRGPIDLDEMFVIAARIERWVSRGC